MKEAILCLLTAVFSLGASGQASLPWDYPCKPGTGCWNALKSVAERQDACQIKGIGLSALSTEELLLITMEHPFFRSYVAHDSPLEGMGFALEGFNGFEEFRKRPDAIRVLKDIYSREDFSHIKSMNDSVAIGNYTLKWTGVEILMCDERLLNAMQKNEIMDVLRVVHEKLLTKRRLIASFGGTSFAASSLIYYRLVRRLAYQTPENLANTEGFELFEQKLIVTNPAIVSSLLHSFDEFIQQNR